MTLLRGEGGEGGDRSGEGGGDARGEGAEGSALFVLHTARSISYYG